MDSKLLPGITRLACKATRLSQKWLASDLEVRTHVYSIIPTYMYVRVGMHVYTFIPVCVYMYVYTRLVAAISISPLKY